MTVVATSTKLAMCGGHPTSFDTLLLRLHRTNAESEGTRSLNTNLSWRPCCATSTFWARFGTWMSAFSSDSMVMATVAKYSGSFLSHANKLSNLNELNAGMYLKSPGKTLLNLPKKDLRRCPSGLEVLPAQTFPSEWSQLQNKGRKPSE